MRTKYKIWKLKQFVPLFILNMFALSGPGLPKFTTQNSLCIEETPGPPSRMLSKL